MMIFFHRQFENPKQTAELLGDGIGVGKEVLKKKQVRVVHE